MNWMTESAIVICLFIVSGGAAIGLMGPLEIGGKNGITFGRKSRGSRLFSLLLLIGLGYVLWTHSTDRGIWILEDSAPVVATSNNSGNLSNLAENQQRLVEATQRLEKAVASLNISRSRSKLGWVLEVALGVCMIIFAGGLINYIHQRTKRIGKNLKSNHAQEIDQRLEVLEKRITDLQDVMIHIDDKLDRPDFSPGLPKEKS